MPIKNIACWASPMQRQMEHPHKDFHRREFTVSSKAVIMISPKHHKAIRDLRAPKRLHCTLASASTPTSRFVVSSSASPKKTASFHWSSQISFPSWRYGIISASGKICHYYWCWLEVSNLWQNPALCICFDLYHRLAPVEIHQAFAKLLLEAGCSVVIADFKLRPEAEKVIDKVAANSDKDLGTV